MKKALFILLFSLLILPVISAEIFIQEQPKPIYNLGDQLSISTKISATKEIYGFFQMHLICLNELPEFYKEYIFLKAGEEKTVSSSIFLFPGTIGSAEGLCKIKASLIDDYTTTNDFIISKLININLSADKKEFKPGQSAIINGQATKPSGSPVNGIVRLSLVSQNIELTDTVQNGNFELNLSFPKNAPAGQQLVSLEVYERDSNGNKTNSGFIDYNVAVEQIPTSLEIFLENDKVEPGTPVKIKAILHDQTGEKIQNNVIITIKNSKGKIIEQMEKVTDEFLEYEIKSDEAPLSLVVYAVSNKLTAERNFEILPKQAIKIEIVDKTLVLTNTGNIAYNKTLLLKVGDEAINIETNIPVGKTWKYAISAPDGEYQIELISNGESILSQNVALTGKVINIKETGGALALVRRPYIWIFVIGIFGFVALMFFKEGYKRIFFGKEPKTLKKERKIDVEHLDKAVVSSKNRAELSLSIKGERQDISAICIKIKNLSEIKANKEHVPVTLKHIIELAEEQKAVIYENGEYLFFFLVPVVTKTFKNEKPAIKLSLGIKEILSHHNKLFQQRIDFGISVNRGAIVAKKEKDALKFMSLGNLITLSKKIASFSNREVMLSQPINEKVMSEVKTELHKGKDFSAYSIKEIRDREENKHFLKDFIRRMESGR